VISHGLIRIRLESGIEAHAIALSIFVTSHGPADRTRKWIRDFTL
jgi:hypothetical protein